MPQLKHYWIEQVEWWSSRSLEWWAAHLTAAYVGGALLIMGAKFDELVTLKLNEIGDLAAGVFGPIAFLWLILGYVQQGKELRVSSEALQMQAEEMKALVSQQVAIVETQNLNLLNHEISLEPLLDLVYGGVGTANYGRYFRFTLNNNGSYCEHLFKQLLAEGGEVHSERMSSMAPNSAERFTMKDEFELGVEYELRFYYKRTSGNIGSQGFVVIKYLKNGIDSLSIIKRPYKTSIGSPEDAPDFMLL
jgi:hypothetical protein